jgi:hypothetical protein
MLAIGVLLALGALAWEGWRLYDGALAVRADVQSLELLATTKPLPLDTLGPLLAKTRADMVALRAAAGPCLPVARHLGWVPAYGHDLAAAEALLDFGANLAIAADEASTALAPIARRYATRQLISANLADELLAARPGLEVARQSLARAAEARTSIQERTLSPWLRDRLLRADALLPPAQDALDLAHAAPELLGADGPRSYLLLAQDSDELRATGGFIGAAAVLTFDKGRLAGFSISDSAAVDDLAGHPYPAPPAPLLRYMGVELWTFRDANWSPDFPTSARAAMDFYQLGQGRSVYGALAFDQSLIRLLLAATGPLSVEGSPAPISAGNVREYMSAQYHQFPRANRKAFMAPLARAIAGKLAAAADLDILKLAQALNRALEERHLLVYLEDSSAAAVLGRHGWDGAVRPGPSDFLMVVDSNLGYNKVNPNIQEALAYSVDLSDPRAPAATLAIRHQNRGHGPPECPWQNHTAIVRYEDFFRGCYWDYLRVLVPAGSQLLGTDIQPIPRDWLLGGIGDRDTGALGPSEGGVAALNALLVVPMEREHETIFRYRLPARVLTAEGQSWRYRLTLQKQAGTGGLPVSISVQLPRAASVQASSIAPIASTGQRLDFTLRLDRDRQLDLTFAMR